MALTKYRSKRNFKGTPEPAGKKTAAKKKSSALRFVIQLHDASRKHYDLRLELDGTMKSWAVPKGPSLDPMERRLAVEVEDHPLEYNEFEGVIPRGNYGAGVVMIWDEGTYTARAIDFPAKDEQDALRRGYSKGHMTFILEGSKLQGEFALIRLAKGDGNNWLLVKKHDAFAKREEITHSDRSVRSGRTLGEIAAHAPEEGKLWDSRQKKATKGAKAKPAKTAKVSGKKKKTKSFSKREPLAARFKKKARKDERPKFTKLMLWRHAASTTSLKHPLFQPIYDGYRAQILIQESGEVAISSKAALSITKRFPQLVEDLSHIQGPLLLDGIIVPLDAKDEPRRRGHIDDKSALHYAFYVYDLLHADGYDLQQVALKERLQAFQQMLPDSSTLRLVAIMDEKPADDPVFALGQLVRAADEPYRGSTAPFISRGSSQRSRAAVEMSQQPSQAVGSRHEVLNRTARPGALQQVSLSNLDKIYWPKEKITKGQMLEYYKWVAPLMLPHLQGRPQSLNRHPNGINGSSFFQKEVSGQVPGWMQTATIGSGRSGKSVTYALCQTEADLLFLANLGCIEINTWLSRVEAINSPDFVVFDLDPGEIPFDAVVETARMIKRILDEIGAPSFCKTSGSRGLHIYLPITGAESFDEARHFAQQLSQEVNRRLPDTTSLERSPDRRTHRIYLDYLQNRIGQTMAAIYSVRPKPNATVSTPLKWTEVKRGLDPTVFTMASLPKRLARLGDLWLDIGDSAVPLAKCQKALDQLLSKPKGKRAS